MPPPLVLQLSSACPLEGPSASCSSCWDVPSLCMGKYPYHEPSLTLDSHVHGPFAVLDTVVNVGVKPTIPLAVLRQYFNYACLSQSEIVCYFFGFFCDRSCKLLKALNRRKNKQALAVSTLPVKSLDTPGKEKVKSWY